MSPALFSWALFFGAAAIALWIVARFPHFAPQTGRGVTAWLGVSIGAFFATPPAIMAVGGVGGRLAAAMFVALPSGICMMLAVAFMMLWVIRALAPYTR